MDKLKFRRFLFNIFLLILSTYFILNKYYVLGLILIFLVIFEIILAIIIISKKIENFGKGWANTYIFNLILFVSITSIFSYFITKREIRISEIIFVIFFIVIIWLYLIFVEKHKKEILFIQSQKSKKGPIGLFLILTSIGFFIILVINKLFFYLLILIISVMFILGVILMYLNYKSMKKKSDLKRE